MRKAAIAMSVWVALAAPAQEAPAQKTLAASLDVFVYPQKGQTAEEQSQAEMDCYAWSVLQTGNDPFQLKKKAHQQAQATEAAKQQTAQPKGSTVGKETLKGAALGTLIGGISGNEGQGAAWGALAGLIRGNRVSQAEAAYTTAAVDQQGRQMQQETLVELVKFKKAFSVCLEGKGYMVKY